jgi:exodeoxyribonuclease VII small subunit
MAKNQKFEDSLQRLEKIVETMESSDMDLDKSLSLFEEGIKLVRTCSTKLEETKKKVEVLVKKGDQRIPEPFVNEETEKSSSEEK